MRICILLLAAAALAAAPVQAQRGRAAALCQSPADGSHLPGMAERKALIAAIQDSLRTELTAAAREAGIAEPAGLFAIQIRDRRSGAAQARAFAANVSDDVVARVLAARAPLLARWPEESEWLHVRLDGPPPSADPRVECVPAVENINWFAREMAQLLNREQTPASGMAGARLVVRMLVSREGDVVFATLARPSPRPGLNDGVLRIARDLRFRPATADGVPVDVWVEQPVEF
ncbi:MAG TPA: TonB family protein [Longimicrobium sp.]|nr:TonB family protein [Longimicrobium sp.]